MAVKVKYLTLIIVSFTTLLFLVQSYLKYQISDVQKVLVISRHGARTSFHPLPGEQDPICLQPIISYGKHQHKINQPSKNCEPGDLVQLGFDQHKELGKRWRLAYSHLIGSKYDPSTVYLRSSDTPRTRASLAGQLEGMYPVPQNVTVYTPNSQLDGTFPHYLCNWRIGFKQYIESQTRFDLKKLNALRAKTNTTLNWDMFYDSFQSSISMNQSHPATDNELRMAQAETNKLWNGLFCNQNDTLYTSHTKAAIGPIFDDIESFMQSGLKFGIFSSHDTVIAPLMSALTNRAWECELPRFASDIVFELLAGDVLRVFYQNRPVKLAACGEFACPIAAVFAGFAPFKLDAESRKGMCETEFAQ
ncbi:Acid phosphatase [Spironucleus salmonicida]|uniref:Acid phosphatase n=1 Tax=Spironucleus salmonicida TaxID=348837 RepID=V6M0G6_9EUKA|nr:Acid phosphatase [Spironucleus salmonicida]|eukprot:EST49536.1 Histidine acid phosphatase family protein [Spironucleus salmonicida]